MGLIIIRLILGVVFLVFTLTLPYSVLAQTPSLYNRPSLQDKTGEYAIVVTTPAIFFTPPPQKKENYAHLFYICSFLLIPFHQLSYLRNNVHFNLLYFFRCVLI